MKEPKDIIYRKAAEQMDDKKLNNEIRKLVSRLNSRLSALEKLGLNEESFSYDRTIKWLNQSFGTNRFSGSVSSMSKQGKAQYYAHLQHFNRFHLTKTQIQEDKERFTKEFNKWAGTDFTSKEISEMYRALNKVFRDGSDEITRLRDLMGSDEVRDFFITQTLKPDEITDEFMDDLKSAIRTFAEQDEAGYEGAQLRLFFEYYDPAIRRAIVQDPVTEQYYDIVTNEWVDRFTGDVIQVDPVTGERL